MAWGSQKKYSKDDRVWAAVGYNSATRDGKRVTIKWGSRMKTNYGKYGYQLRGSTYWKLTNKSDTSNTATGGDTGTRYYGHTASTISTNTWYYTKDGNTSSNNTTAYYPYTATLDLTTSGATTVTLETYCYGSNAGNCYPTVDISFDAAATCTITFDDQSGSGGPGTQNFYKGYAQNLSSTTPTRTGYTFQGWYTGTGGSGTKYNQGQSYTITSSFTLYAYWTKTVYTNTIAHWTWGYVNGEGNNSGGTAYKLADTTFTQEYESSYVMNSSRAVTIPNGFYLANTFGTSYISGTWTSYTMPYTVTQKASAAGFEYDYRPNTYTITYTMNGGSNPSSNPTSYNVLYGVTFATPTRTGYNFTGWTIGGTTVTGINPGANATFSSPTDLYNKCSARTIGNKTVVANWSAKTFTVTFNPNGGSVSPTSKTVTYASTYGSLPTPTKTGYRFLGWYTASSGGTQITSSTTVTITTAQTLWAHWQVIVSLKQGSSWAGGLIYIKTDASTWKQAQHIYVKTSNGWKGY